MLVNHTHERLAGLGLPGMAKAFDDQQRQPPGRSRRDRRERLARLPQDGEDTPQAARREAALDGRVLRRCRFRMDVFHGQAGESYSGTDRREVC